MRRLFPLAFLAACASPQVSFPQWQVSFTPMIDMTACGEGGPQWSSQVVEADGDGHFDTTWAPSEPDTAHIVGDALETGFSATVECLPSGGPTGTLAASPVEDHYEGTFELDGQSGSIEVDPGNGGG
jgi:hypothetical protein